MKLVINQHTVDPLKFLVTLKPNWFERNILRFTEGEATVKKTGRVNGFGTTEYITPDGNSVNSYIADEIDLFIKRKNW